MPTWPLVDNEAARLAAVRQLGILDSPPEAEFDALVQAASLACDVPVALISLIDAERQWFKASIGLPGVPETSRDVAFCAYTIVQDDLLEVADAASDPRFADNPLVTGAPDIRFYAGAPLRLTGGMVVGSLSVIDRRPRQLSEQQRALLRCLARATAGALDNWRARRATSEAVLRTQASEDQFRRLFEQTPAMLHSIDAQGRLLMVSDTWLARFGYSREEVIGRDAADFLSPLVLQYRREVVMPQFLATGRCDNIEYQMVCKDGTLVDVLLSAILQRDADGTPLRSVSVLEELTARRTAERALAAERQRLENIIAGTGAGTWEWNVQTGAMRLNDRSAAIIGRTVAEMQPLSIESWREYVHPDDLARARALLPAHFAGETERYEVEARMFHRDGHMVWVLARGAVVTRTEDGRPEWMFGIHLDITARKRQEEALRRSECFLERTGRVAGVGGWEYDLITGEIDFSAETCRIYGVAPGWRPSLGQAISYYPPETRPVVRAAVQKAAADGAGWDLELPMTRADGAAIWVRTVGSVSSVDGKPVRLFGAFQDVTSQVRGRLALEEAHERVALATDSSGIGIWSWDLQAGRILWDAWVYRLHGIDPQLQDGLYDAWAAVLHPQDRAATEQALRDSIERVGPYRVEYRVIWADGSVHHLRGAGHVIRDAAGRPARMAGATWDITEPRRLAAELAEQHELLRVTLRSIGDGVITTDAGGLVTWLNPVAERLTGWPAEEARGRKLAQVFHVLSETTREPTEDPVAVCLAQGRVVGLANHTLLVARDGREFGIEDSAAPIRNERGDILGVVLVFHDVTEQRRMAGELSYRATHDPLTGLINRTEFELRMRDLLHRAHAGPGAHALLYIDLDQFKVINDTCGHAVGDQVLNRVARLLADVVRTSDTLARLGGDEFAVILEHCPAAQAERLAARICERMEQFRFTHEERRFRIGASIGLVPVDRRWATVAGILQAADSSCYAAKEAGRNRVHMWFDSDAAMRTRQGEMQWTTRLERALDENRFVLFAQRIVPLGIAPGDSAPAPDLHGSPLHAEVLLRMQEADGTLVPPGAFLPAAERFHLASRLDRWVLREAVRWLAALPAPERLDTLCVNLSGQSVGDRAFHRWAGALLGEADAGLRGRLCMELTETAAVTNLADAALFIEQMRGLGVRVALDDFGAGAASFGYLKTMPVDFLKIDGQFIRDLLTDPLDAAAVRCFADVAKIAGMRTVAECVDHPDVLAELRRMGIEFAQGFLLHRPAPIDEMMAAIPAVGG